MLLSPEGRKENSEGRAVSAYTSNQAEHHRIFSYREEIRKLLKRHRLAFDE
jgi:hypothetical protein